MNASETKAVTTLAPIVLFVYNRPWHTQQTIEALQKNELASESVLFIYSDAPKAGQDQSKVQETRDYIHSIGGFKKITIIEREKNWGLANSIIDGVTAIVNQYGKIIVLEDDLVTSPYFLRFMNDALEFYKDVSCVWHINGWNNPIDASGVPDLYFSKIAYSWGWATWKGRWVHFNKDTSFLIESLSKEEIYKFNLDGTYNMWDQVILNNKGSLNTWAVFWYGMIFLQKGLCLNNNLNLIRCIGTDGTGENCGTELLYLNQWINNKEVFYEFEYTVVHNDLAFERLKLFTSSRKSFFQRAITKIKRLVSGE